MKTKYVYTKGKLEQTERALKLACERLSNFATKCPVAEFGWKPPFECSYCILAVSECWQKYFLEKASEK
jgi:hypothetical protein